MHCSPCREAWQMFLRVLFPHELSWPPLFQQEQAASPKQWPDIFGLLTLLAGPGTREVELMHLPGLPKGSVGSNKDTASCEILQQRLTEGKTPVLFLDKRINKIKRLSKHQWKIACHFDSTLEHEAGASSSFHSSCNAIILALNGDGCHSARRLFYCVA